jgi:hypothetical protein
MTFPHTALLLLGLTSIELPASGPFEPKTQSQEGPSERSPEISLHRTASRRFCRTSDPIPRGLWRNPPEKDRFRTSRAFTKTDRNLLGIQRVVRVACVGQERTLDPTRAPLLVRSEENRLRTVHNRFPKTFLASHSNWVYRKMKRRESLSRPPEGGVSPIISLAKAAPSAFPEG